jgi:NADH-quinone oxidoreductase subunit B
MGIETIFGDTFITTKLSEVVGWGRKNSLYPLPFGTACCGIEFMATMCSDFDQSRFGAEVVRFSPRQSDMLMVAGTITQKMAPILKKIYDQMLEPKYVIAIGVCASSGGFYDNYSVLQGIDTIIPVDVYVPGCPPHPAAILDALINLQDKVQKQSLLEFEGGKKSQ